MQDFERELAEERKRKEMEEDAQNPGWKQVEIDTAPVEITIEDQVVLEEEPMVAEGVAAALLLATKKGRYGGKSECYGGVFSEGVA